MKTNVWLVLFLIIIPVFLYELIKFVYYNRNDKILVIKKILFSMVLEAEKFFGGNTGKEKLSYVIKQFYRITPKPLQKVISFETLERLIEEALEEMREYLETQKLYVDGKYNV